MLHRFDRTGVPAFTTFLSLICISFVIRTPKALADGPAVAAEPSFGIPARIPLTTSKVIGSPDPALPFTVVKAFPQLIVRHPIYLLDDPDTNQLFLVQHLGNGSGPGRIVRLKNDPSVSSVEEVLVLDYLVYSIALHPDFAHNGYMFVLVNGPVGAKNRLNRIMRYTIARKPPFNVDEASQVVIIEWDSNGHSGGGLAFGPDGFLYHASGDGTGDSDSDDRGQNPNFLTAKMIRIDVDHQDAGKAYSIPKDNPWINTPGFQPEAWAMGFRNPWRLAFDRKTGDLWVGQNGQDLWEQVYLVHKGENYGWSRYEGGHAFQLLRKAPPVPVTFPIVDHSHSEMRSLTGGIVYRGTKVPELDGAFIYGDYSTGRIFGVKSSDHKTATWNKELARTSLPITGFHETREGDVLVLDHGGAALYKLVRQPPDVNTVAFPRKLSETGLFVSTKDNQPSPALIPYDVNAPLWSDGAIKERFMAIPGDDVIDVTSNRGWNFTEHTTFVKTFSLDLKQGDPAGRKRVETRLLTKQGGQWVGYSYIWNDEQTDAVLVDDRGASKTFTITDPAAPGGSRLQTWSYPSRSECMMCHSRAMNYVLGLTTLQLNRDIVYPNGIKDNQLRVLGHLGVLHIENSAAGERMHEAIPAPARTGKEAVKLKYRAVARSRPAIADGGPNTMLIFNPENTERLTDPYDITADLNARARSYLHANCAICHVGEGGGNSLMLLEFFSPADRSNLFDARPQHEIFGIPGAKIITGGHPELSLLLHRISTRGPGQMPPLASSRVDEAAVKMLREWIEKLPPTTQPVGEK